VKKLVLSKNEMLEQDAENKCRIDLQNEQLEFNERKACDKILRGTICSTRANGSVCSKENYHQIIRHPAGEEHNSCAR
jgi:hypothetical protein